MDIKQKLWKKIKSLRLQRNLSQEQFAYKAKLHRTYISDIERWEKNVSVENIEKIANALWVTLADLFSE